MAPRCWLHLGVVSARVDPAWLPWPLASLAQAAPAREGITLHLAARLDPGAGVEGPLTLRNGALEGPGFRVVPHGNTRYDAVLAAPECLPGALAAALVDLAPRANFAIFHAATLLWRGGAVLVLGRSGAGKSTLAARHPKRAAGSNAAMVWRASQGFVTSPLPLTGKGDAAVRPGVRPLQGALMRGATAMPHGIAGNTARWLSLTATALGGAPPLDTVVQVAREFTACPPDAMRQNGWGK